jgi:hypothetical protein
MAVKNISETLLSADFTLLKGNWKRRLRRRAMAWVLGVGVGLAPLSGSGRSLHDTFGDPPGIIWLAELSARGAQQQVRVRWTAFCDTDTTAYQVERSADGCLFTSIGTVAQVPGPYGQTHTYELLDYAPLAGLNYYRIRQTDHWGMLLYSEIVAMRWSPEAGIPIGVPYPNPATAALVLPDFAGILSYQIRNTAGVILQTGQATAGEHLDLYSLPDDLYFLEIASGPTYIRHKFLKRSNP